MTHDTIAAIATAPGEAGIAVIRVSGPASLSIADRLFSSSGHHPSRRLPFSFTHGWIKISGKVLDEVILLVMRAPHSYTREDVVEIQCHGGIVPARRILQAVLRAGARLAGPGEFTQRAFLNGRIDLVQAEAVLDLIQARSDRAASAALEQLEGSLSLLFEDTYNSLLAVNADLEATLDFSEDDDISPTIIPDVLQRLEIIQKQIGSILETWAEGHLLREGALVVISGKPNVGKSTLLNILLGKDRAIVSSTPGTTRDIIEEILILDGIPLRLVDTAGLRTTACDVENEGVRRARHHMQKADIHLYLMDISQDFDEEDEDNIKRLDPNRSILIMNKSDLGKKLLIPDYKGVTIIQSCMISKDGVNEIRKVIVQKLGFISSRPPHAVISERHRQILISVGNELSEAVTMLLAYRDDVVVLASSKIRMAIESLGQITGKTYHEELLNTIFSKFCVGK
ncbi:MAG: tRNA uridine-5-carboxymethylaminomethyl(34) synthesis GTPase MnmE [Verrucomicrobia bacterium]|nr:tRNA uridine-5-carboxymethylaminomethyl(34) synthesis GTPase MnmE [Verrucomicrobiota bacterium]MCG2678461.1 tRNA uridine-5-carboxymethylaminomethyl(34) synthesis GTPase MnmE [Kiritimatiellia bacterium]MBU4248064.1 tRNA uridine-5-carboxymethylaminomethyl(34) synthesis GTPase MnmE [Verrucomicrobiota bacterium]MBU4290220.1 tRNA uridine-5-carboxymethylaminomethyl(34) synthesis GTPase MnmE [Verrucomicrobiota bacterium]MBU4430223.1 tRNA uridine-5-carboxymethylaminomethyl(34) synthesis GTPase MnmE 